MNDPIAQEFKFGDAQEPSPESAARARASLQTILASIDLLEVRDTTRIFNLLGITLSERIALAESDIMRHMSFGRSGKASETKDYREFYEALRRFVVEIRNLHQSGWAVQRFHLAGIFRAIGDVLAGIATPDTAAAKYVAMHLPASKPEVNITADTREASAAMARAADQFVKAAAGAGEEMARDGAPSAE